MTAPSNRISAPSNRISRRLARLDRLPGSRWLKTMALRRVVPFLGTAGLEFVALEAGRASLALGARRRVQNHVGGIHAAAAALLAEATSGMAVLYHLPDDRLVLLTRMEVAYAGRMRGGLVAVVTLAGDVQRRMSEDDHGEVTLHVDVRDESGESPLTAAMTWAWRPRAREAKPA